MAATTTLPRPKNYDDTFWKPITLWLTTTDHKLIGIMYMVTGLLSFIIGGIFALIIRLQLAQPNLSVVDHEAYNQLISAHGVTMIFFFVTIFLTGIANYMVPIMIGARDMAFPRVNLLGFWLVPVSILLYYGGVFPGGGRQAGGDSIAPPSRKPPAREPTWVLARTRLDPSLLRRVLHGRGAQCRLDRLRAADREGLPGAQPGG